jgi:hypothetical protein
MQFSQGAMHPLAETVTESHGHLTSLKVAHYRRERTPKKRERIAQAPPFLSPLGIQLSPFIVCALIENGRRNVVRLDRNPHSG